MILSLPLSFFKDVHVIIEAENGGHLLMELSDAKFLPDVILLDVQMPYVDGIKVLPLIKRDYPDMKVIMMSIHSNDELVSKMLENGADFYVSKDLDAESIYQTIKNVFDELVEFQLSKTDKP